MTIPVCPMCRRPITVDNYLQTTDLCRMCEGERVLLERIADLEAELLEHDANNVASLADRVTELEAQLAKRTKSCETLCKDYAELWRELAHSNNVIDELRAKFKVTDEEMDILETILKQETER